MVRLKDHIKLEMIQFCGQLFLAYCVAPGRSEDSLLSPQLEHWKIVPDHFIVYRAMYNEVDHRTYHKFDSEQWTPTLKWNGGSSFSPYEIAVLALITLLVIFIAVCILSIAYLFYHLFYTFCIRRFTNADKFKYTNISAKDVIENRVVNV